MFRLKKVFVEIYLQFNLGDDLFLEIIAKKFPGIQFTVNYLSGNYDNFISDYPNVERRKYTLINKIGQKLKLTDSITNYGQLAEEYDALLFIGGSIFREENYHDSLYKERMNMVNAFKQKGKYVFVLGANFGPYKTEKFISDYKDFFKLCDDVCFRDQYSYNLFKELDMVRYAPDIVFQLDISKFENIKVENKVGISIIDVRHKSGLEFHHNSYVNSTVNTIKKIVSEGKHCCLISFCEIEGDVIVAKEILEHLSDEARKQVSIYEYKGDINDAIKEIATFEKFIAARFHANILGILLGKGVLPIIYSEKITNVLIDLGISDISIDIKDMDKLDKQCKKYALLNKGGYTLPKDLNIFKQKAVNQFDKFEYLVNSVEEVLL